MAYLLTADIGGTNARFGLVPRGELRPQVARVKYTADSPSPEAAARQFLDRSGRRADYRRRHRLGRTHRARGR
jgi:glucokinase